MSELFKEIEEDIRRERFNKIWQKIGRFAVFGSVLIIIATACYVGWGSYKQGKEEEKTGQLLQGMERLQVKDYKGAALIFSALTDDTTSPYYPVAMLQKAYAQELGEDTESAKKTYRQLGKRSGMFSDLSRLKEEEEASKFVSVFQYSYREKRAWDALANNNKEEAIKQFSALAQDQKTPDTLASRAEEVLRVLNVEKAEKPEPVTLEKGEKVDDE